MSSSSELLLPQPPSIPGGFRVFAQDVASGVASATRFIVTFAGCTTLVAVAAAVGDARLRNATLEQFEAVVASLIVKEAAAEPAALAPAEPISPAPTVAKSRSDPAQRYVVQYLSRRYRVADGALRPVVAAAYESGRELGLDPLLILAVTAIESSMNPFAESVVGAQGLMQVMTRVHADKFEAHGG